jgi:hypothetical protein
MTDIPRAPGAAFRWVPGHRSCVNGAGEIESRRLGPLAVLPLVTFPIAAWLLASRLPAWEFMWTMAFALYAGCKWLTFQEARTRGVVAGRLLGLGYLTAWPGMDAAAFLNRTERPARPRAPEWIVAALKTSLGVVLLWVAARTALPGHPLLAGWLGMAGLIFILHFGTFHLLSLGWRTIGVNAMPVMRNPLRSASLTEFWGRRWNTAFHELAARFTFRPLRPLVGATGALLLVFLVSGLIHELVISVPARGGYGLPTGYFLLQGLGVVAERTQLARVLGLGRGWRGTLFTIVVAGAAAFWLFPPRFIHLIVLPMLTAIGAA